MTTKYNNNIGKFLKNLDGEYTAEEVERDLSRISEEARTVLEVRWGLVGNAKTCINEYSMAKKLGRMDENPRLIYHKAITEFKQRKYVDLLCDADQFDLQLAANIGFLATELLVLPDLIFEGNIKGKEILEMIESLKSEKKVFVLKELYGLNEPYKCSSLKKLGEEMNLTRERVRQFKNSALRILRHRDAGKKVTIKFSLDKFKKKEAEIFCDAEDFDLELAFNMSRLAKDIFKTHKCPRRLLKSGNIKAKAILQIIDEKLSSENEKEIIQKLYGLMPGYQITSTEELATLYQMSHEEVMDLKYEALKVIRTYCKEYVVSTSVEDADKGGGN